MASTDKTLVDLFPWAGSDEVLINLRLLMKALEGRLSPLEEDRVGYVETITTLRDLATRRVAEVLDPAEAAIRELIGLGFSADKISDATPTGRALIRIASYAALKEALSLTIGDIEGAITGDNPTIERGTYNEPTLTKPVLRQPESQGGTFGNPAITGGTVKDLLSSATGEEIASAAFVRALIKTVTDGYATSVLRYDRAQALNAAQRAQAISNVISFLPMQQGGGIDQDASDQHRIIIGLGALGLMATVDATNLGMIWTGGNFSKSGNGYERLPNGKIHQWASVHFGVTGDRTYNWPMAFPNECLGWSAVCDANPGTNAALVVHIDGVTKSAFNVRRRSVFGGSVSDDPGLPGNVRVMAVGW